MIKVIKTCDICGKEICGWHYKYSGYHYRIGYWGKYHMCNECYEDFKKYVNEKRKKVE